jgi:uncharacterized repeat protein (TIGR01451 family)
MTAVCSRCFIGMSSRWVARWLVVWLVLLALVVPSRLSGPASPAPDFARGLDLHRLPLSFVPNRGQTDPRVQFQAHAPGGTLFFTPNEVMLSLPTAGPPSATDDQASPSRAARPSSGPEHWSLLRLRFENANPAPEIIGRQPLPGIANYFIHDDPAAWRSNLPTYGGIIYRDVYPGIDLSYDGTAQAGGSSFLLKGTYTVAPGADPGRIRWRYAGAAGVRVDETSGDLFISLVPSAPGVAAGPEVVEHAPVAWQTIEGRRVPVSVRYALNPDGSISFALGGYDPAYALILDPTLSFSTYLGGSKSDAALGVAVDSQGNVYLTGQTASTDFPILNAAQPDFGGGSFGDVFVAKLDPTASTLLYATYLGGVIYETGYSITVDAQGNAYVTGDTISPDFPVRNAVQPVSGGGGPYEGDAFIVKLSPTGSQLIYSTYLGGKGDELSYGIALDGAGNAYVTGYTSSVDFPTVRAAQPHPAFPEGLNVDGDAFVTQVISASGVYTWGFSTYLGGTEADIGRSIAVDASGRAYVTGRTGSPDFPTVKAVQPSYDAGSGGGNGDAFVTQVISASGVYTWGYSTYLGGSGGDTGYAVALDELGDVYVTGETSSTDFPTASPLQSTNAGGRDAFVTKIVSSAGGYAWGYSTYLGGGGDETGRGIALNGDRDMFLAGFTTSTDFPTSPDGYDRLCGSDGLCDGSYRDAWLAKLDASGGALSYATYLGGSRNDDAYAIALDTHGGAYVAGETNSTDFPTSAGVYDPTCGSDGLCNGAYAPDAFVLKIAMLPELSLVKSADPPAGTSRTQGDTIKYTLVATNDGSPAANVVIGDLIPAGTSYVPDSLTTTLGQGEFDAGRVTVSLPILGGSTTLTATFQVTVTTGFTKVITNRADLTGDQVESSQSNSVSHPVRGTGQLSQVYLPLVLKDAVGLPPAPGCAPCLVASIGVGDSPRGLAIDAGRRRVYVANYGSDSLSVLDANNQAVIQTVEDIPAANGVAYDPVHNLIWVTSYDDDQVIPIDAQSLSSLPALSVGDGPWGVVYDPVHDAAYVVNSLDDSVTVIDAATRAVTDTLTGGFDQPFQAAVNVTTGKVYVTNFGGPSVTVVNGTALTNVDFGDLSQPYGVAVDETRGLVYVATVESHRLVVLGSDAQGSADQVLGWAALYRGFGDHDRPVPLRAIAVNPDIGPAGDGGHLWTTTSTADGSEVSQALLIPKGWDAGFNYPTPYDADINPAGGIALDRLTGRVYLSNAATPGVVTVLGDSTNACLVPFGTGDRIGLEMATLP